MTHLHIILTHTKKWKRMGVAAMGGQAAASR